MRVAAKTILPLIMLAVLLAAPALALSGNASLQTFKVKVQHRTVYNVSVSNSTVDYNYTLPTGWNTSVVENIYVAYELNGSAGSIALKALDENGSQIGSATVTPLASGPATGYLQLPGVPAKIELSTTEQWSGTITVIVESTAEFSVTGVPSSLSMQPGASQSFTVTVTQKSGPGGDVWWTDEWDRSGVSVSYAWSSSGDYRTTTSGAGWSDNCTVTLSASSTASGDYTGTLKLWFDDTPDGSINPNSASLVAEIKLSYLDHNAGQTTSSTSSFNKERAKQIGVYAAAGLGVVFIILLLAGTVKIGRRGMTGIIGGLTTGVLVLLVAIAAMGAGLAYAKPEMIAPVLAGIGAFAVLVILTILGKVNLKK